MRLKLHTLDPAEKLLEFDFWITPTLGEIKDTDKYKEELAKIVQVLEILGDATGDFSNKENIDTGSIARTIIEKLNNLSVEDSFDLLDSLAAFLFLVTGKTDNNSKCQLPLFLMERGVTSIPVIKKNSIVYNDIPRELKATRYMSYVNALRSYEAEMSSLLLQFIEFILSDPSYIEQLWSLGHSYFILKARGEEQHILSPLVVFKVRGSVSATGGHDPEMLLREVMKHWGLRAQVDFNLTDVPLSELIVLSEVEDVKLKSELVQPKERQGKKKQRKYDFVLPYKVQNWTPSLFIQCQFYAGDSGSVSHKNVDQTSASRRETKNFFKDAKFIEYVDGAGYYSTLNGDLRSLLEMVDTYLFFQIKSAPIRLRYALQEVGFITPLEIEHAILKSTTETYEEIQNLLENDGYSRGEITRALNSAFDSGILLSEGNKIRISSVERRAIARRYLLLDVIGLKGSVPINGNIAGLTLIPGFGRFFGLQSHSLIEHALTLAPKLKSDWTDPVVYARDIDWLQTQGYIKMI